MKNYFIIVFSVLCLWACDKENNPEEEQEDGEETYDFVVAKDGSGDFESVQEAFDAVKFNLDQKTYIFVKNGTYKEVLRLPENKNNIVLIGEEADKVILTFDNFASKINPETGEEFGTSGSSSNYIYGDDFYAENISFENSAGPVGQALAIYINGDKAVFANCNFLGWQDTVYTGRSRQYFEDCYIEGSTDFIFGPSTSFFENCELFTKGGSAITAASTEEYVEFGYVFNNCKINGEANNITTLGRPWRPYAAVAFLNTEMSASIEPRGWDNWGDEENEETARYVEFQNSGEGASPNQRVEWLTQISSAEAEGFSISNVLGTTYENPPIQDNWNPKKVIEEVGDKL